MPLNIGNKTFRNIQEQVLYLSQKYQEFKEALAELGNVMRYCGSVATYADLPTENNQIGDVYNVLDTGNNYAWDGEVWDEISSIVDLSGYTEKEQDETITGQWTFQNTLETTLSPSYPTWNFTGYGASGLDIIYSDNSKGLKLTATLLRPQNDNDMSLGNSSYRYKDLHLGGKLYLNNNYFYEDSNFIKWYINGIERFEFTQNTIRPITAGQLHLGSSSLPIGDLYLSGQALVHTLKFDSSTGNGIVANDNSDINFIIGNNIYYRITSQMFRPMNDNVRDLGQGSLRWRDAYIGRNISDGTNSVTVADLANLIAYAKAQGWIS